MNEICVYIVSSFNILSSVQIIWLPIFVHDLRGLWQIACKINKTKMGPQVQTCIRHCYIVLMAIEFCGEVLFLQFYQVLHQVSFYMLC